MLYVKEPGGQYLPATEHIILEEARRVSRRRFERGVKITSTDEAREAVRHLLGHHQSEVFCCLFVDAKHRVLEWVEMFKGSVAKASVHPREVVKEALRLNAAGVIFCHNHPSGDNTPSADDIYLTKTLRKILAVIDVKVLDHLIIGEQIASMAEAGHLA
ncbi:DNA repair protein RadC [Desulfurivibrio sp. D14AmB]|uniref:RadC family protein n=1 Tax=Desulfurivibrio sp. D14AmB TaxID=3374370 RepID=UPI00376EE807